MTNYDTVSQGGGERRGVPDGNGFEVDFITFPVSTRKEKKGMEYLLLRFFRGKK
jgi:hypothetical protein